MTSSWIAPPGVHPEVLAGSLEDNVMVVRVRLDPGAVVPAEVHEEHHEQVIPLSGHIDTMTGARDWQYCGDYIGFFAGTGHSIRNASDTRPAEYLAVMRRREASPIDRTPT